MTILLGVVVGILVYFIFWKLKHKTSNYKKLPSGPRGLPIIGNLNMISTLPHHSFQKLSQKYGDIMSVRLGQVLTIVVSSSSVVELFLKTHDIVFSSQPKTQATIYLNYGRKGIAFSDYIWSLLVLCKETYREVSAYIKNRDTCTFEEGKADVFGEVA